jgi:hypothetical protein
VLFNYTLNLDRFELAEDTTYDLYVYAARSNRVPPADLPLEAPMLTVGFCHGKDLDSPFRFNRDCQGAGPWRTTSERMYGKPDNMITDLIRYKNHFWCHHCGRGLFFPVGCIEHADTISVVSEGEDEVVDDANNGV